VTIRFEQTGFDIRAMEAAAAVASAPEDKRLLVFQDQALRLYARADAEMVARGDVTETLIEIALRHGIAAVAGDEESLQHLLSEAAQGRRALQKRDIVEGEEPGLREKDHPSAAFGVSNGQNTKGRRQSNGKCPQSEEKKASHSCSLQWLNMCNWDNEPVPQRKWAIKDLVPLNQAGLLSGEGGPARAF